MNRDREAVARIIDPDCWDNHPRGERGMAISGWLADRRQAALAKADTILALRHFRDMFKPTHHYICDACFDALPE